jgi:hypothetical protein
MDGEPVQTYRRLRGFLLLVLLVDLIKKFTPVVFGRVRLVVGLGIVGLRAGGGLFRSGRLSLQFFCPPRLQV